MIKLRRLARLLLLLALFAPASARGQEPQGRGERLLVDSRDAETLRALSLSGTALLVDYGAFSLWQLPPAPAPAGLPLAQPADEFDRIYLRGAVLDTRLGPPAPPLGLSQARTGGGQFWLAQFAGPVKDAWLAELDALGLQRVAYLPNNAYVLWGDAAALARLDLLQARGSFLQWTGPYHPAYRLAPGLARAAAAAAPAQAVSVTVQFHTTGLTPASLARLLALGGPVHKAPERILNFTNVSLDLPAAQVPLVAAWPDVFNVEPWAPPERLDEVQGQILAGNLTLAGGKLVPSAPGYLAWLAAKGFPMTPASYPIVDVVDDGLDQGDPANVLHPDFHELGGLENPNRVPYIGNCTTDPTGNGVGGHGNLNAGIVAAYNDLVGAPHQDALGYRRGLGVAPYGRVASTKIFRNNPLNPYDVSQCGGTDQGVVLASYSAGAGLTSNSWGYPFSNGAYTAASQAYDLLTRDAAPAVPGNQEMLHVFAAGNAGPEAGTVLAPGTAKNVLTVGATENVRDQGVLDGCGAFDADSAGDLAAFSGRGPTDDGRMKPDLVAPGTHVQGPASQDPGYTGAFICGAQGSKYYPVGQTLYTWSSGTSHATPALAGAAALLYEYYGRVLTPGGAPSPAMLKALLINAGRYLGGAGANDTLPGPAQGWGGADLGRLFDGAPRVLLDQGVVFSETGQEYTLTGAIADSGQPLRVTLAWTDAPGSTTGAAFVNDLDLELVIGGVAYKGNVFEGAHSAPGGARDPRNNVENVFLPAGLTGNFLVRVVARNIAGDGLPGDPDLTDQDFALVVYNAQEAALPVLVPAGAAWDDALGNGDGVIDPGETIALALDLQNVGAAPAQNVTGGLALLEGSAALGGSASGYPGIAAGGAATNAPVYNFTVTLAHDCGAPLAFEHAVAYDLGQSLAYPVSLPVGTFTAPGPLVNYAYAGGPVPIPDNNPAGASVTALVPENVGWVGKVDVRFSAAHTAPEDLDVNLISPQGTLVELSTDNGLSGSHYTGTIFDDDALVSIINGSPPFTGRFRPESPLAALIGEPAAGLWTLKVVDDEAGFTGAITEFSLDLRAAGVACHPLAPHTYYLPLLHR